VSLHFLPLPPLPPLCSTAQCTKPLQLLAAVLVHARRSSRLPQDQVDDCLDRDIDAVVWNSETDDAVKSRIVQVSCFIHLHALIDMRWQRPGVHSCSHEAVAYTASTQDICCGEPATKLLYTTPESLAKPRLMDALKEAAGSGSIYLFAVDEAHCVSQVTTRLSHLAPK